jgi:Pentapeptide repeats (8 copies)
MACRRTWSWLVLPDGLQDAIFHNANLQGVDLRGAKLSGTNLYGTNLGATLDDASPPGWKTGPQEATEPSS